MVEALRTACPRNGGAFSYNPVHLSVWYMPEELWARLPTRLTGSIAAVQHAGAAVFTGFERLETLGEALSPSENAEDDIVPVPGVVKPRGLSTITISSNDSDASATSSLASSVVSTPLSTPNLFSMPVSPFSLSPSSFEKTTSKPHQRHHARSYTTPMEPDMAYYTLELSHLRTESLPCLRHAIRVVDRELNESKRLVELDEETLGEFEAWWVKKKATAIGLDQKGLALSIQRGIPTNGLGWSA
ncbi:uncharacterized protein BDZ99DRAFT_403574 [Mytilinidion resinicola]|uniref:Uncharacterized protein n=1 Tax=Mytilinidion resinicola TaxID=574789 RepID=A0A6A6XYK1_9PEZI|nr:uncharacterized protein BDZ99DRAFT_403574 [Mytilinidion resinicola]KAF2801333.1 hypothetical protein BDZ99DRAFT_403574 [Mytilinidion resinicola]